MFQALLPNNVGVTDTAPIRNIVAIDWKSYRSPSDCSSPIAIPACENSQISGCLDANINHKFTLQKGNYLSLATFSIS